MTANITPETVTKMLDGAAELRKFLDGSMTLDRLWFGEVSPKGMIFWWRQHLGRIDALMEAVQSLSAKLAEVTAERDSFRAVLEGAKYGSVDAIAKNSVEVSRLLGATVKRLSTRAIIAAEAAETRVAELTAENERLRDAFSQSRLAFAGYVSVQSAINKLDALKGDKP